MLFNLLNRKLKKSYDGINPEIGKTIFPNGEAEYIYVGTMLHTLFKDKDVIEMIKVYASVYSYYQSTIGNIAKTYLYAKKKAGSILLDFEIKNLIALVMFNIAPSKQGVSNPVDAVEQYRRFVEEHLCTVDKIKKHQSHFEPKTVDAGTQNSPLLVDGVCGVRDYINALNIHGVNKITYKRNSTLYLTDNLYDVSYAIDEYKLFNAEDLSEIATLWFNIYGTENTDILPACLSDKEPFSAEKITHELFETGIIEWQSIEKILQNENVPYEFTKLVMSTFAYLYVIWTFGFKGIRIYQSNEIEGKYVNKFAIYAKQVFENAPYKEVLESEVTFKEMIKRVDRRVRKSYHENNLSLIDDGLTDEFLMEFIPASNLCEKIKPIISKKIMQDWAAIGKDADERYLT